MSGVDRIAAERQRQIDLEGWDADHDRGHADELAMAAATYALPSSKRGGKPVRVPDLSGRGPITWGTIPDLWPWAHEWWKPADRIRELEKAGALIAAAIDDLESETIR